MKIIIEKIKEWSPYIAIVTLMVCIILTITIIITSNRLEDAEYEIYELQDNVNDLESKVDDLESAIYTISRYL